MQIVIDIPEKTYKELKAVTVTHAGEQFAQRLIRYIVRGTPLPEGHSDLIERGPIYNALLKQEEYYREEFLKKSNAIHESAMNGRMFGFCNAKFMVADAPIIIPADKEKE